MSKVHGTRWRRFAPSRRAPILAQADLGEDEQVRAMVRRVGEELGRVDILIANAAATAFRPLLELKPHHLARTFNLSVGGFVAAVQESARLMNAGGRVVMISGIDSIRFTAGHGALGAAKAALESMVRDFAFELGPRGITVNGVNFALIDSDSSRLYMGDGFRTDRAGRGGALGAQTHPQRRRDRGRGLSPLYARRRLSHRANHHG